jgi:hypothetical protein
MVKMPVTKTSPISAILGETRAVLTWQSLFAKMLVVLCFSYARLFTLATLGSTT